MLPVATVPCNTISEVIDHLSFPEYPVTHETGIIHFIWTKQHNITIESSQDAIIAYTTLIMSNV
jgi:hypothetical protein